MELSIFLANIFGLSIITVSLSLLLYPEKIKKILDSVENKTTLFFIGIVSFIIGSSLVLTHNIWAYDWKVIVTLFSWAFLIIGIVMLFLPKTAINILKKVENSQQIPSVLVAVVIIGCVLIYFGFTA